ncbi:MAG TPA: hypothetical protein P5572_13190 [Phycisphaerae bacterium]|nr:hypothetical protein [Phycisphaerae bacterium]
MSKKASTNSLTTLTARFDQEELMMLRQAAEAKQWSLAQLIRVSVLEKSVNILNACGPAAHSVRRLLDRTVKQLFDARPLMAYEGTSEFEPDQEWQDQHSIWWMGATRLSRDDASKLASAMAKLGGELAPMLREEIDRILAPEATEKLLDPSTVVSRSPEPQEEGPNLENSGAANKKKATSSGRRGRSSRKGR